MIHKVLMITNGKLKKHLEICNTAIEKYPDTFGAGECRWLQNTDTSEKFECSN